MPSIPIVPAVLPKDFEELESALYRLRGVTREVQIDFMGTNVLLGKEALPLWEEFDFEFDLMLPTAMPHARKSVEWGASRVVVHAETRDSMEALQALQEFRQGEFAIEVGVALNAHDTTESLRLFEGLVDFVQVMGIDTVGHQGEPPDPHHKDVALIRALRAAYPELSIQVDGAVAPRVRELVEAGATRLVVGSAIVTAADPKAAYKELYNKANGS